MGVCDVFQHLCQVLVLDQFPDVIHIRENYSDIIFVVIVRCMFKFSNPLAT